MPACLHLQFIVTNSGAWLAMQLMAPIPRWYHGEGAQRIGVSWEARRRWQKKRRRRRHNKLHIRLLFCLYVSQFMGFRGIVWMNRKQRPKVCWLVVHIKRKADTWRRTFPVTWRWSVSLVYAPGLSLSLSLHSLLLAQQSRLVVWPEEVFASTKWNDDDMS